MALVRIECSGQKCIFSSTSVLLRYFEASKKHRVGRGTDAPVSTVVTTHVRHVVTSNYGMLAVTSTAQSVWLHAKKANK